MEYWSAAREGECTLLAKLLENATAENINFPHPKDATRPLSIASANGHTEIVEMLLRNELVDVNATDKYGRTAVMMAGSAEIAQLLVDFPLIDLAIKDTEGQTALDKATYYKRTHIIEILGRPRNNIDAS
jgi:ankyrin repeat protein